MVRIRQPGDEIAPAPGLVAPAFRPGSPLDHLQNEDTAAGGLVSKSPNQKESPSCKDK